MTNISSSRHIANNQEDSTSWLLGLDPTVRFTLGLLGSAVGGWYIPQMILIFTTGIWAGSLSMWLVNAVAVSVLMGVNLIGNKFNRVWLIGGICALLFGCYQARQLAMTTPWEAWHAWIPQLIVPPTLPLLNAFLLVRYKRVAQLEGHKA